MMEVEAAVVEDVVETGGCEAEEDQPHQGRSEALDESSEVGGRRRNSQINIFLNNIIICGLTKNY